MRPMKLYELKPGKTVWLESYGWMRKTLVDRGCHATS